MRKKGLYAALASAIFLGMAPVLGKQAIRLGIPPLGVVAVRTALAAFLLLLAILIFKRGFLYIYPAGLLGCLLAGGINGVGSLFYYAALGRIDASLGQLLYSLYPLFLVLILWLDHQPPSRLTLIRLSITLPAIFLLTRSNYQDVDLVGILMMLLSALLYAAHLPINQRVLFDMPAPTVTFYTLLAMSLVVVPAFLLSGMTIPAVPALAWNSVMGLALVTFLSRLTLFLGVKNLGGLQTALLGLSELLVTLAVSHLWLGERLSLAQWLGAGLLLFSIVLVAKEKPTRPSSGGGKSWLGWLRPPGLPRDIPWPYD
ncbi:MAG TPA: DMT family transporter [Anaerolineales bacterium]|nr:DMT family transporter [Anaerolineales bacterium]